VSGVEAPRTARALTDEHATGDAHGKRNGASTNGHAVAGNGLGSRGHEVANLFVPRGEDAAPRMNGHAVQHQNGQISNGNGHLLEPSVEPRRGLYDRYVKPAIDWLGGLALFLLFLPVMLAVALAVWASLGSPVLIRQQRVGRNGRVFGMFKFRTMHPDRRRQHVHVPAEADRRRTHKSADDPRHTPLGRFLRRMSLDELPQLLNVLAGHMSLVGPRPELADVVERFYEPWQLQRHLVKPGITGLWQVTERFEGNGVMHHHTTLDIAYIEQQSFRTDVRILLRTPAAVLLPRRELSLPAHEGE
jgi:lipopolysaccharide/colanic/teichoic acid biosynthesis glycosyltransferase